MNDHNRQVRSGLVSAVTALLVATMNITAQEHLPELDRTAPRETRTATFALG